MISAERLRGLELFGALSPQQRDRLLEKALVQRYEKGARLFHQGDRAGEVWLVLSGWVHLLRQREGDGGKEGVALFTITPREMLCGVSAIEPERYTATGVAATEAEVLRIPAQAFREAIYQEPLFGYRVLRLCAQRVRCLVERCGAMAEPVSHRLTRSLLQLREQFGDTLPMTHRELAQMSWTTTESAIRAVRLLKRRGLVKGARARLTIVDVKALRRFLQELSGNSPWRARRSSYANGAPMKAGKTALLQDGQRNALKGEGGAPGP